MRKSTCTECGKVFHWDGSWLSSGVPASGSLLGYLCSDCAREKNERERFKHEQRRADERAADAANLQQQLLQESRQRSTESYLADSTPSWDRNDTNWEDEYWLPPSLELDTSSGRSAALNYGERHLASGKLEGALICANLVRGREPLAGVGQKIVCGELLLRIADRKKSDEIKRDAVEYLSAPHQLQARDAGALDYYLAQLKDAKSGLSLYFASGGERENLFTQLEETCERVVANGGSAASSARHTATQLKTSIAHLRLTEAKRKEEALSAARAAARAKADESAQAVRACEMRLGIDPLLKQDTDRDRVRLLMEQDEERERIRQAEEHRKDLLRQAQHRQEAAVATQSPIRSDSMRRWRNRLLVLAMVLGVAATCWTLK